MEKSGKRLRILTDNEIKALYDIPNFTDEEREQYFSLDPSEKAEFQKLRSLPSKVHFILLLGYFKAKKIFCLFKGQEVQQDVNYILQRYFPDIDHLPNLDIAISTRLAQQSRILNLLNYHDCTKENKNTLQEKARYFATIFTKPIYIFKELVNYLESHRIVIPVYSLMQDIVGKAITDEKNRLELLITKTISEKTKVSLDKILSAEDGLYELPF